MASPTPFARRGFPYGSQVLVLALALSGCAHNQWAERAETVVDVPERFVALEQSLFEESRFQAAPEVCSSLGGPALGELNAGLLGDSFELMAAAARLRQAQAAAAEAGAPLLPRIDAALQVSRSSGLSFGGGIGGGPTPFPGGGGATTSYQPSVAVSYEVDVWGKLRDRKAAAALDAVASAEQLAALRVTLSAQLAETWAGLIAQRRLLDLLAEQAETSERFVELTRLRFGEGQGAAQDIGRQQQQLEALRGQIELARGQERILLGQIAVLLGRAVEDATLPGGRALPPALALGDPGLPIALVEARPDLRAALARLQAADRRLAATAKDWLPSLTLSGSVFTFASSLGELFDDLLWQLGARLAETVFEGGARAARVAGADARAEEQLYTYGQALLVAVQEVRAALFANSSQDAYLASLEVQLAEARRVLELLRTSYREGTVPYLDVLTSLQSLHAVEQQHVDASRQQFANRVQLCRALGFPVAAAPGDTAATNGAGAPPFEETP